MSLEGNANNRTEIEVRVTEQAVCTCEWRGTACEAEVIQSGYGNRRMSTSGHASSAAAWDGANHLKEMGETVNPNVVKKRLVESKSYTFNNHTVTITPTGSAKATVRKQ
ncbi:hypothetical protein KA001_02140 [Patescibacteria group bacterium]|nr:hypothetical protein [Patescibacteria group bacterium]